MSSGNIEQIATASGVEHVRETTVDKIRLGGCELTDVKVYAHTFPAEGFSTGVIGLNVLSQFDINLLFSQKLIEMRKFN